MLDYLFTIIESELKCQCTDLQLQSIQVLFLKNISMPLLIFFFFIEPKDSLKYQSLLIIRLIVLKVLGLIKFHHILCVSIIHYRACTELVYHHQTQPNHLCLSFYLIELGQIYTSFRSIRLLLLSTF